jgi:hypothetical protein
MKSRPASHQGRGRELLDVVGSSVVGGIAFLLLQMTLVPLLSNGSAWDPPRWMAALVLGRSVLAPLGSSFDLALLVAGITVHFALAIVYGTALVHVVARYFPQRGPALIAGALFGFTLYIVNLGFLIVAFPWFANAPSGVALASHFGFGLVTVWTYLALHAREDRMREHASAAHV